MDLLALFTTTQGRLARKPFWLGLIPIYLAGLAAQMLLDGGVRARAGFTPFMVAQAVLLWSWLAIHIKRLRDAGQGPAGAIGVAVVYALALCLLLMLIAFLTNPNDVSTSADGERSASDAVFGLMLVIIIVGLLFSPDFGVFMTILKMLIFIACLPAIVSVVFSVVTGTRKSIAPPSP
jgi:uncharacterized membrane protein YhaH (DUF805 family)